MLKNPLRLCTALMALAVSGIASAMPMADVSLSFFIQDASVTNNAASGANINKIVYDLGTPADGIATWDIGTTSGNNGAAGGVASNFLSNPDFAQTLSFSGLSIAPGASFQFGTFDIDLILSLTPLNVVGTPLDEIGLSLINASFSVFWDNGTSGTSALVQQAWRVTQNLSVSAEGSSTATIPTPSSIALILLGLAGIRATQKKQAG